MFPKIFFCCKECFTIATSIFFYFFVNSFNMPLQGFLQVKFWITLDTFEILNLFMNIINVTFQTAFFCKPFLTFVTFKRLYFFMDISNMFGSGPTCYKCLVTLITFTCEFYFLGEFGMSLLSALDFVAKFLSQMLHFAAFSSVELISWMSMIFPLDHLLTTDDSGHKIFKVLIYFWLDV